MTTKETQVTLGGDPEFVFWKKGTFVAANDFISDGNHKNRIGLDGHARTGEIRFKPAVEVDDVVARIRDTLLDLRGMIPDTMEVRGGTIGFPDQILGGHVHYGHKMFQGNVAGRSIVRQTVVFLDYFMGVPLACIEKKDDAMLRMQSNYGEPLDFRTDIPWGFEYRTPYSWIWSPDLTKAVYSISWLLTNTIVRHGFTKTPPITWPQMAAIQDTLRARDKKTLKSHALDALNWLQKFDGYDAVAKNIEFLQRLVEREELFRCEGDTLLGWKLRGPDAPSKTKVVTSIHPEASTEPGCAEIATAVGAQGISIYIYGIKEARGFDFAIKPRYLGKTEIDTAVHLLGEPLSWNGGSFGSGAAKIHDLIIGLSPRLRDREPLAIALIRSLAAHSVSEKHRREEENMNESEDLGWDI